MINEFYVEEFIESMNCDVYPITFVKYFLNRKKILFYFTKAASKDFDVRIHYGINTDDCPACQSKIKENGMLCRPHTSIQRVLNADKVAFDLDTNVFFFKNEIFKMIGDKLVIVYCPHPKMIEKEITDSKVRKIKPITIHDASLTKLPDYKNIKTFRSSKLFEKKLKCWFNKDFSIITMPGNESAFEWCLVVNK